MAWPGSDDLTTQLYEIELDKPPVKSARVAEVLNIVSKHSKYYKHIVHQIESWIRKAAPEHHISGIYLIDAILRKTQADIGKLYKKRFAVNLETTLRTCFRCPVEDKKKMTRVVKLWLEGSSFGSDNNDKLKRALKHQAKKQENKRKISREPSYADIIDEEREMEEFLNQEFIPPPPSGASFDQFQASPSTPPLDYHSPHDIYQQQQQQQPPQQQQQQHQQHVQYIPTSSQFVPQTLPPLPPQGYPRNIPGHHYQIQHPQHQQYQYTHPQPPPPPPPPPPPSQEYPGSTQQSPSQPPPPPPPVPQEPLYDRDWESDRGDHRHFRGDRDNRDTKREWSGSRRAGGDYRDDRDPRDYRDNRPYRDDRDRRDYRDDRDYRDVRDNRDGRYRRDHRDRRESYGDRGRYSDVRYKDGDRKRYRDEDRNSSGGDRRGGDGREQDVNRGNYRYTLNDGIRDDKDEYNGRSDTPDNDSTRRSHHSPSHHDHHEEHKRDLNEHNQPDFDEDIERNKSYSPNRDTQDREQEIKRSPEESEQGSPKKRKIEFDPNVVTSESILNFLNASNSLDSSK